MSNKLKDKTGIKSFLLALIIAVVISVIFNYSLSLHYKFIFSSFAILLLSQFSKLSLWITTIIFSIIALMFPMTLNFGVPSKAHLLNTANTTFQEAIEFILMVLSVKSCLIVLISIILLVLYLRNGLKALNERKKVTEKKYYKYIRLLLLCLTLFLSYKTYPPKILVEIYKNLSWVKQENNSFEGDINKSTDIIVTENQKKFKNVVIIIGESVTSDYLQVMGYPHETTPNLQKLNGHFYKNFISAAPYTYHAIHRTLNYCPDKLNYQLNNNLINIANQAGFATYYFAAEPSEGMNLAHSALSKYNTSNLPKSSKLGKISLANPYRDDMPVLNYVRLALSDHEENRMIFLHMLGHHPRVCKRLRGYPNYFKNLKHKNMKGGWELNCYLSVTRKLDDFITDIYTQLKELNEPFAIFYLSDHGVIFDMNSKGGAFIHHGIDYKSNYRVPYIVLTSDIKEHKIIDGYASGFDFLPNLFYYLGLETNIIKPKSIQEITTDNPENIVVFDGDKLRPYVSLKDSQIEY